MKTKDLLAEGRQGLADEPGGELEAEILLSHVMGVNRAWLYANPDHPVTAAQIEAYRLRIRNRVLGEPVAYLTGVREFWSLPLKVTAGVLIPRPETELLVETALTFIPADAAWRIADLGTGSGAVALAIACERPSCEIHATEISAEALRVARENAEAIAPGRVQFHHGSWLEPLTGRFRVIVSNPPYVAADDPHLEQGDCRFEPRTALTPGMDALYAIRRITDDAARYLQAGGLLAFEHGFEQGEAVREILAKRAYTDVKTARDLAGLERVTSARKFR